METIFSRSSFQANNSTTWPAQPIDINDDTWRSAPFPGCAVSSNVLTGALPRPLVPTIILEKEQKHFLKGVKYLHLCCVSPCCNLTPPPDLLPSLLLLGAVRGRSRGGPRGREVTCKDEKKRALPSPPPPGVCADRAEE